MIEQIKKKFESGYYEINPLTEEELYYISANEELFDLFCDNFLNKENFKFNFDYFIRVFSEPLFIKYVYNNDNFELKRKFMEQYVKAMIKDGSWDFCYLSEVSNILDEKVSTEEISKFVLDYIYKNIPNIIINNSEDNITLIINNGLYDLFPYVKSGWAHDFDDEIKAKLIEAEKDGKVELSRYMKSRLELPIDRYTIEDLINIVQEYGVYESNKVFEDELAKRIKELINSNEDLLDLYISKLSGLRDFIHNRLDMKEKDILFKKGLLIHGIPNDMFRENFHTANEIYDIFLSIVEKSYDKVATINKLFYSFYDTYIDEDDQNENGLKKEILLKKIIEKGYGLALFDEQIPDEQIERIIQVFNEGGNKIDEINKIYDIFKIDKRILKILFDNIKINDIKICPNGINNINDEVNKEKLELLHEFLRKHKDVKLDSISFFDKEIFDYLLESGDYNNLASSIVSAAVNLTGDLLNWINSHENDSFLFYKMICKISNSKSNYIEEIFYPALKYPNLADMLIEYLVHNDGIKDKFSDEFYERVKYHLAKKYSLDINKMDMIEKHFGPNIIMYIEDSNIQKIINMDEEQIQKLFSLFPKVSYTLSDIEAGYESINQYAYGRQPENTEVINIFPNLLRAVNDHNDKLIKKYKYKLLSIIDDNTISGIMDKYKFTGTPIEFIDYLLSNLGKQENVDILHEVANNVILLDRKFYRNNHFYMEKKRFNLEEEIKKCVSDRYSLRNLIINTSSSVFVDVFRKFGIKKVEEFYELYSSEEESSKLIISAIIENLCRLRVDDLKRNSPIGYTIFDELGLEYDFDEKRLVAALDKYYLRRLYLIHDLLYERLKEKGISDSIYNELYNCFVSDDFSSISPEAKKYIGIFNKIATEIIHKKIVDQDEGFEDSVYSLVVKHMDDSHELKRVFKPSKSKDLYPILMGLNLDLIEKNVFKDKEIYDLYIEIMKSKKVHLLDPTFYKVFGKDTMPIFEDSESLAGFINFFKVIAENVAENNHTTVDDRKKLLEKMSVTEILRQGSAYSAMSSIYSSILGREDAGFIKKNPDPNSSKTKNTSQRFTEAVEDTITCYNKQSITTPTLDEIVQISNGKTLEVVLGNFTSPCNITHGERTGACMRIGGVGEALYKFSLNDENGFHIRIEDPKTHKYISRVTGFRNGNTVYLNQLRVSLDKRYSNHDLVEAVQMIAKKLIEMTKDSDNPIENVFVTDGYAMSNYGRKCKLNSEEITRGLGKIYTDYSYSDACILASTKEEGYAPLKSKKVPAIYKVQRSKPRVIRTDMEDAPNLINRVHTIKQLLAGKTIENDELEVFDFKEDLLFCVANDDWYIYVDRNLEIKSDYIDKDPRAKEEFDKYMLIVEEMLQKGLVKEKSHEQL